MQRGCDDYEHAINLSQSVESHQDNEAGYNNINNDDATETHVHTVLYIAAFRYCCTLPNQSTAKLGLNLTHNSKPTPRRQVTHWMTTSCEKRFLKAQVRFVGRN